jgi:hypothetical protein
VKVTGLARPLNVHGWTTQDPSGEQPKMFVNSLMAMTDNRKRMAILSLLTFMTLC